MAKRKTARSASRTRTPGATRAVKGGRGGGSTARKTATRRPAAARKGPARASTAKKSGAKKEEPREEDRREEERRRRRAPAPGAPDPPLGRRARQFAARGHSWRNGRAARAAPRPTQDRSPSATTPPRRDYGKRGPADRLRQIERDRRIVEEDVPTPPSSLDLDRRPSAARTGRAEMEERLQEHTAAGPDLTAGDVDADWEAAYSTGDETPGGDMPTPDQAVVAEIGTAIGVEYADNEELKAVRQDRAARSPSLGARPRVLRRLRGTGAGNEERLKAKG